MNKEELKDLFDGYIDKICRNDATISSLNKYHSKDPAYSNSLVWFTQNEEGKAFNRVIYFDVYYSPGRLAKQDCIDVMFRFKLNKYSERTYNFPYVLLENVDYGKFVHWFDIFKKYLDDIDQ